MAEVNENAGRERRQHDRFFVHKRIEVLTSTETFNGVLRDISVGGAAIKVWAPLYQADIVSIDINDLGEYEGQVLRSIEDETFAVEFETNESEAVELAAELVGICYGAGGQCASDTGDVKKSNLTP